MTVISLQFIGTNGQSFARCKFLGNVSPGSKLWLGISGEFKGEQDETVPHKDLKLVELFKSEPTR